MANRNQHPKDLWNSKIESIREQIAQLSNEMAQYSEHHDFRHYSVILITQQPKFLPESELIDKVEQTVTAMASASDLKKAVVTLTETLHKHIQELTGLSHD